MNRMYQATSVCANAGSPCAVGHSPLNVYNTKAKDVILVDADIMADIGPYLQ